MGLTEHFAAPLVPGPGPRPDAWPGATVAGGPARRVAIIGSTGSIGKSALAIARDNPGFFEIASLSANKSLETLADQAVEFGVRRLGIGDSGLVDSLASALRLRGIDDFEILTGVAGLSDLARDPGADTVLLAMVGAAGVAPALAAAESGKRLALANKEALVAGGSLVTFAARRSGAVILPVDSEHSAIFQCLASGAPSEVRRIILTASGGPFRTMPSRDLEKVIPAAALKHPNWSMGGKITIDSATLMNKGLELIEARWLFDIGPDILDVVVHPQSVIHSMVEFIDGSVVALLGVPDMRVPIIYALSWPRRYPTPDNSLFLDLVSKGTLTFERPDYEKFPCLGLAIDAMREGGFAPAIMNAANEVAVEFFLNGAIGFMDIPRIVGGVMEQWRGVGPREIGSLEELMEADETARRIARDLK